MVYVVFKAKFGYEGKRAGGIKTKRKKMSKKRKLIEKKGNIN